MNTNDTIKNLAEHLRCAIWYWQVNTPIDHRGPTERDDMQAAEQLLHLVEAEMKTNSTAEAAIGGRP